LSCRAVGAAIPDHAGGVSRPASPFEAFDAHFDAVSLRSAFANLGLKHSDFGLKGFVSQPQPGRNGAEPVAAGFVIGGQFGGPGRPVGDTLRRERFESDGCIGGDKRRRGHGPIEDGVDVVGVAGNAAGADPVARGAIEVRLSGDPELHDGSARVEDRIDLPGRGFRQNEVAGTFERDAESAACEALDCVGPEGFEKPGALERVAEDVAMQGRIFPPAGFVAIELIGREPFEREIRGFGVFGLKFDQAAFEAHEAQTSDGEFADEIPLVSVSRVESFAEAFNDRVQEVPVGLGDVVPAFETQIAFDRFDFDLIGRNAKGFEHFGIGRIVSLGISGDHDFRNFRWKMKPDGMKNGTNRNSKSGERKIGSKARTFRNAT